MGRCDVCGRFIARCFRGNRCKRCVHSCARRRTEEDNAQTANQNESQLVAEVEPEEVMEREITLTEEENKSTALKPQKWGTSTENVAMLNKAKEPTEGMVVRGLTCEQVLLQYIRSAQSGHTVAAVASDGSETTSISAVNTDVSGSGSNGKTTSPSWLVESASVHDGCNKNGEQWISGIQRQETIKCLQKWGFTSEQIVQYMTGGSEKTSSVVSLRMSAGESSTSSMGTRQQFAGNILDGSSLGDIPSVGTSIAGHSANSTSTSTTMNRSISIFGTTMAGKHKVVRWDTQRHKSKEAKEATMAAHKRSITEQQWMYAEKGSAKREEEEMRDGDHDVRDGDVRDGDHDVRDGDVRDGDHDVRDGDVRDGDHDVRNGDVRDGDHDVRNGDLRNGDRDLRDGDRDVRDGDHHVRDGDHHVRDQDVRDSDDGDHHVRDVDCYKDVDQTDKNAYEPTAHFGTISSQNEKASINNDVITAVVCTYNDTSNGENITCASHPDGPSHSANIINENTVSSKCTLEKASDKDTKCEGMTEPSNNSPSEELAVNCNVVNSLHVKTVTEMEHVSGDSETSDYMIKSVGGNEGESSRAGANSSRKVSSSEDDSGKGTVFNSSLLLRALVGI